MLEIIGLIALFIATSTDMYNREIPDNLSHGLIIFALTVRIGMSVFTSSFQPIIEGIVGLVFFFSIGWALYKVNQWGGGDAKILGGLGALMGFWIDNYFMVDFFINLMIVGALYGIFYSFYIAHKNKIKIKKIKYHKQILIVFLILIATGFFIEFKFLYYLLILILLGGVYLMNFISSVQNSMVKKISVLKLTEGDWVAEDVKVGKKTIARKKENGLTEKQLKQLKKLYKKNKIKKVKIKEGIPFLPSFFIAFIITWIFGNIILAII